MLEPVTDEKLERAKSYVTLGFPSSFESVGQIASQLGVLLLRWR